MRWLTSNAGLKIVALVLAMFTWLFVKGITSDSRTIEGVPLEIRTRPGLTVLQTNASTVSVAVRGTREDVRQVSRQDLSAVLDLVRDDRRGLIAVKLTPRMIRHSRRIQVTEINPAEVLVDLDELVTRELPVEPEFTGELAPGLAIERVVTKPEAVDVKGPKTLLNRISKIDTLPIDVSGRRTSFRERVELMPFQNPESMAQRHWVEVDVRIGPASSVDTGPGRGVEDQP
ncbi:MAG TPA: CdaR family protein [Verrucomicrobiae bacterium]|nr:CdaR family protein [Verrucomicrobiae bacterium]